MEISNGIRIVDLFLYLENSKTLVIGDVHIGYEEEMTKTGYLVPRFHFKDVVDRTEGVLEKLKGQLDSIVLVGDLKHEFGSISDEEWRNTLKFIDFLASKCGKLVLIQGDHDTHLGPIADKRNLEVVQYVLIGDDSGDIMICHGDKLLTPSPTVEKIIIGHEHPSLTISDGVRDEKVKCFLKGSIKIEAEKYELFVVPSLTQLAEGTNVLKESLLSPYLKKPVSDVMRFEAWIVPDADNVMYFGHLKSIQSE